MSLTVVRASLALTLLLSLHIGTDGGPIVVRAAGFLVNSTVDAVDANPGDGVCATSGGVCTLRAATLEANALPGADASACRQGGNRQALASRDG